MYVVTLGNEQSRSAQSQKDPAPSRHHLLAVKLGK